jgi:lipopolysaccharide transport system ATP-binding protein
MAQAAIQFINVWKKFRRGERYDSLRDLIPALTRRLLKRGPDGGLKSKEFWALQNVSFELKRGDAIGIIGPNGSGKSTVLKLLSNILKPERGTIRVRGRTGALIELGAGFHPDLTGRENIYLNGTILGMKKTEINRKFDSIVEFAELKDVLDTPVKRYSSGMYARLGFSVAVHIEPEVLIVDEVLSVGDYHFQEKCFAKMKEFTTNGTTLVFVSHNLAAISSLCNSALLLQYGDPVYEGDVRTAISKYYTFYEENASGKELEVVEARLTDVSGVQRDVFDPGETATLRVRVRALSGISKAHAAFYIQTRDGQLLFDTATSRFTSSSISLRKSESATIEFHFDLNLQSDIFRLGFSVTSARDEYFMYYNMNIKQLVMTGNSKSNGFVHLNPRCELIAPSDSLDDNGQIAESLNAKLT